MRTPRSPVAATTRSILARARPSRQRPAAPLLVPVLAGRCREDQHPAAERRDRLRRGIDLRELTLQGRRVVQDRGTNPATSARPFASRSARSEPRGRNLRTELRRPQPDGPHLEHALGSHLMAPPGTSQTPQVIGASPARPAIDHATSSSRTGRCLARSVAGHGDAHRLERVLRGAGARPSARRHVHERVHLGTIGLGEALLEVRVGLGRGAGPPGSIDRSGRRSSHPTTTLSPEPRSSIRMS